MWATRGLAVALALSVLPDSRALRPGDCEGAGGRVGGGMAALSPRKPRGWERRPVPGAPLEKGPQSYFPGLETLTRLRERVGSVAFITWPEAHIPGVFVLPHHFRDYRGGILSAATVSGLLSCT